MNDTVTSIHADPDQPERSIVDICDSFNEASDIARIFYRLMWDIGEHDALEQDMVRKIGRYGTEAVEKMKELHEELFDRCRKLEKEAQS